MPRAAQGRNLIRSGPAGGLSIRGAGGAFRNGPAMRHAFGRTPQLASPGAFSATASPQAVIVSVMPKRLLPSSSTPAGQAKG